MSDPHRTIAVLGEMAELGPDSTQAHRDIGREAAERGVDVVIAVGQDMAKQLALYAAHHGVPTTAIVADNPTAIDLLNRLVKPGDVVLVKGSRSGMYWQIAEALADQPVTPWGGWNDSKENPPT